MKKENIFKRMGNYLTEIRGELKKVTWPTRIDMQKTTIAVIIISIIFGIYLQLIDFSFRFLVTKVIDIFRN